MSTIITQNTIIPSTSTAIGRWLRLGPWYAMFPMEFAFNTVQTFTTPGDSVLDPFLGRGTTVCAATALGRHGVGCEINPVAWLYGKVKIDPANEQNLYNRLSEIYELSKSKKIPENLPEFFEWAFCPDVLKFLLVAREKLNWLRNKTDRTLMAMILVDLHGKEDSSFSNQMRQTKAMSPAYSIKWWKERDMRPKNKNPAFLLEKKISWRYKYGPPNLSTEKTKIYKGDSTKKLKEINKKNKFKLLLTSPPYFGITNYNYDQWLRRWMLDGDFLPQYSRGIWESKFSSKVNYHKLLLKIFSDSKKLLDEDAIIVVRTDARDFTHKITEEVLLQVFHNKKFSLKLQPIQKKSQTALFGDKSSKPGEIDIVLTPN